VRAPLDGSQQLYAVTFLLSQATFTSHFAPCHAPAQTPSSASLAPAFVLVQKPTFFGRIKANGNKQQCHQTAKNPNLRDIQLEAEIGDLRYSLVIFKMILFLKFILIWS